MRVCDHVNLEFLKLAGAGVYLFRILNPMLDKKLLLILKSFFIVAYLLVFGEMFLRVFAPVAILPRYISATDFGIRGNLPNFSYWHKTPEYKINIRTNSKGIRADREIAYEKPVGVKRIVVLGDSFGMGYEVSLEDSFLNVLERTLNYAGKKVEVVNLSVSGHGNAEQLIMLQEEGFKYNPDVVLLAWQKTDLNDNVRSGLFGLEDEKLVVQNKEYLPAVKTREFLYQFSVYLWLENNSHLYTWIREKMAALTKEILVGINSLKVVNKQKVVQELGKDMSYEDRLTIALLKEIRLRVEKNGASFFVFVIPDPALPHGFTLAFPRKLLDDPQGMSIVNVVSQLEKYKNERLYWDKSHWHFTPRACGIVGRSLAEYLLKKRVF